jgi:hypothetical protein
MIDAAEARVRGDEFIGELGDRFHENQYGIKTPNSKLQAPG